MAIHFISDLHLDKSRSEVNSYFLNYLSRLDKKVTDLYILGDLFEYWIGDDDPMDGLAEIKSALYNLGDKINIWYMHGNRDFLISNKICSQFNMNLITDPTIINKNNIKILLMHGDTLCIDDIDYQNFRKTVRSKKWQEAMLSKSLEERLSIASNLRKKSQLANKGKSEEIMDVNHNEVIKVLEKYKPDVLIHGHTHRPNIHQHNFDSYTAHRYVLGDWYNRFFVLTLDDSKFSIMKGILK